MPEPFSDRSARHSASSPLFRYSAYALMYSLVFLISISVILISSLFSISFVCLLAITSSIALFSSAMAASAFSISAMMVCLSSISSALLASSSSVDALSSSVSSADSSSGSTSSSSTMSDSSASIAESLSLNSSNVIWQWPPLCCLRSPFCVQGLSAFLPLPLVSPLQQPSPLPSLRGSGHAHGFPLLG